MTDNRKNLSDLKPVLGYLLILILFALGTTLLITLNKGWKISELDEAIEQSRVDKKAGITRSIPQNIRPAAAAGRFYPAEPEKLYQEVGSLLSASAPIKLQDVRAVLVPHAAYIYSGDVAAAGFREIIKDFKRVFILAANHSNETHFSGVSLPEFSHYEIPGVQLPLDNIIDELLSDPLFVQEPASHKKYVIEVELPFLYGLKGQPEQPDFTIIPMILGQLDDAAINRLAEILNSLADEKTLFVFSVDLSHFYTDTQARQLDSFTIQAIMGRDNTSLSRTTADGPLVLLTMTRLAELNGWESTLLQYKNSGAVSGDLAKVVGYAAIAFHKPLRLNEVQKKKILEIARAAIEEFLERGDFNDIDPEILQEQSILKIPRGVFVTLKKNGQLRGCIGDIISTKPLHEGIQLCAVRSAVKDARFPPVTQDELDELTVAVSVLEFPTLVRVNNPLEYPEALQPGKDGVIMVHKGRRSTFLPHVWHDIPAPIEFLSRLCLKQNSPPNCWQDSQTTLYRYGTIDIAEDDHNI
ncbi:MAG: AmmeMemoRadiSam system protein B [Deltaproteobacteria bacterium]|jgi:AmmeMemoRadiSam system protein B/AmmeMemoRadiSam system protein A|nr:AmmeMemoRadiSam system protein B [Deltaproteobacteria bacterium]